MAMLANKQWKGHSLKVRLWIKAKDYLPARFSGQMQALIVLQYRALLETLSLLDHKCVHWIFWMRESKIELQQMLLKPTSHVGTFICMYACNHLKWVALC